MVEGDSIPSGRIMTSGAVGAMCRAIRQLSCMVIFVTGGAIQPGDRISDRLFPFDLLNFMTFRAIHPVVLSKKRELRLRVIEADRLPGIHAMAGFTSFLVDDTSELPGMLILMTLRAPEIIPMESGCLLAVKDNFLLVTCAARNGPMRAGQGEFRPGMFRGLEQGGPVSIHGVAEGTFPAIGSFRELALMIILVTGGAFRQVDSAELLPVSSYMTFLTCETRVQTSQGEACRSMVEVRLGQLDRFPADGGMALVTGVPERTLVMIFMTVEAGAEFHSLEQRKKGLAVKIFTIGFCGMTFQACRFSMLPDQFEACLPMGKP